jgi:hypothetical protein
MKSVKFFGAIAGIILLYALSIGPAFAAYEWQLSRMRASTADEARQVVLRQIAYTHRVQVVYAPVIRVTDQVGMRNARIRYCKLWMDAAANAQGRKTSQFSLLPAWLAITADAPTLNLIGYPRVPNWPTRREDATTAPPLDLN